LKKKESARMCGIVGYVGQRPVQDLLLAGLTRLEYRGYDSAGISMILGDTIESVRAVGNLDHLREAVAKRAVGAEDEGAVAVATRPPTTGIGHTRWATHGRVNECNAHPHFDTTGSVHVVVNGIVENYMALKERLIDMGAVFTSETDAEVIAHLISHHLATGDLAEAVRAAYAELEGHYAFVAMRRDEPDVLVGARRSARSSSAAARRDVPCVRDPRLPERDPPRAVHRERRDRRRHAGGRDVPEARRRRGRARGQEIDWDDETAEKGGFETFMLKEIHEQADAVAETIADRTVRDDGVDLDDVGALDEAILRDVSGSWSSRAARATTRA
jgi:glucosamine--fructose-6-phosphate aminotransferase (isomerizing)